MKRKLIVWGMVIAAILLSYVLIRGGKYIFRVHFADAEMEAMIARNMGHYDDKCLTVRKLRMVKQLNIGYTSWYGTLKDIKKCENLQELYINYPRFEGDPDTREYLYYCYGKEMPRFESKERVREIEEELQEILIACDDLSVLSINNGEIRNDFNPEYGDARDYFNLQDLCFLYIGNRLTELEIQGMRNLDISALQYCENIKKLNLNDCEVMDYQALENLQQLEILELSDTNIAAADYLLSLKTIKKLSIKNTPLAKNGKELKRLKESLTDTEIEY